MPKRSQDHYVNSVLLPLNEKTGQEMHCNGIPASERYPSVISSVSDVDPKAFILQVHMYPELFNAVLGGSHSNPTPKTSLFEDDPSICSP